MIYECYVITKGRHLMKHIAAFVISSVGGIIPELTLSYIAMELTGEGWLVFLLTYVAIQLFYLLVWFFRSLVNWFFFRVFWKKQLVEGIYEELVKRRYPNQGYFIYNTGDVEAFFEEITFESRLHTETRIHAASLCTRFNVLRELGNFQGIFRLREVAFEALNKYFKKKDGQIDSQRIVDFS